MLYCFESLFNHPKFAELHCQHDYSGDATNLLHELCPAPLNKKMVFNDLLNAIFCAYCVKWRRQKKHEADERRKGKSSRKR
jgi:hypothetical protein